jgi:putative ABC transport system permease protein
VGTVVFPYDEQQTVDEGIAFTPDGLSDFLYEPPVTSVLLTYAPGLDPNDVEAALSDEYGLTFTEFSAPHPPASVRNLGFTADVARALGVFFAVLGVIALVHTLIVSTSRRRGDLAILRSLGFERRQVRWAITVQSLVLTALAVVIGIPAGLVIGRFVWRHATSGTGAIAPALTPTWFLVGLVAGAVVVAVVAAWWPGRVATRRHDARWLTPE